MRRHTRPCSKLQLCLDWAMEMCNCQNVLISLIKTASSVQEEILSLGTKLPEQIKLSRTQKAFCKVLKANSFKLAYYAIKYC